LIFAQLPSLPLGLHEQCSLFIKQKWKKDIYPIKNERGSFLPLQKGVFSLSSLFIGLKSNQKRLLNFCKELVSALSAVAEPLTNLRCVLWLYCLSVDFASRISAHFAA
jgi:hypothetical protein